VGWAPLPGPLDVRAKKTSFFAKSKGTYHLIRTLLSLSGTCWLDLAESSRYHLFSHDTCDTIQGRNSDERLEQFAARAGQWGKFYGSSIYFGFAGTATDLASGRFCAALSNSTD
jgi:hypothetical protein